MVEYLREHYTTTIVHASLITWKKLLSMYGTEVDWSVSPADFPVQFNRCSAQQVEHSTCSYEDSTVACSPRRRNSSWDEEIMKEGNREVPEKKPLRFPKIGDITLKTWLGFILGLDSRWKHTSGTSLYFLRLWGTRTSWCYICTSSW